MALEGQQGVVAQHAAAIVGDANETAAAGFHFDANLRRARVERVFEQFLDHRSGTLHHLAGGDLVGDLVGQNAYAAHAAHYSPAPLLRGKRYARTIL